ncbi:hypothetical protein [Enterobacter cloacae complex sp. IR5422]|uniref:hypothetical protein n=1 Tax=Enterobacter cloacae complex sp. IR5422 TaxID=3412363 RepID=UPI003B9F4F78
MKPSIIIKPARDNSRNRRREARKTERAEEAEKCREERKAEILEKGGLAAMRGEKAAEAAVAHEKTEVDDDSGGDAMFKVVNHAHQRNPNRKW